MRRFAWCALALAAACGSEPTPPPGPLDQIRLPTGMAVRDHRVLVASSNADLLYDTASGGTLISLDPTDPVGLETVTIAGAVDVPSFAGELGIARPEAPGPGTPGLDSDACGPASDLPAAKAVQGTLALFATRGSNTFNVVEVAGDGALSCSGPSAGCGMPGGFGFGDPYAVSVACGNGRARAFFSYMTTPNGVAALAELDLRTLAVATLSFGIGPTRGMAYDRDRDRLYMAGVASAVPTPLRWLDLAGCNVAAAVGAGGCTIGSATFPTLPAGLELRSIALAHSQTPGTPRPFGTPIRAYITARLYDTAAAASVGYRTTDFGGLLMVVDLFEDALGGVQPQLVWTVPIGLGAQDVKVLPRLPGWSPSRRDVVAALAVDEGVFWIYDDETRSVAAIRTCSTTQACDLASGAPVLGHQPSGLAVDPVLLGSTARVWVGSYQDSFVTPIDVTLDPEVSVTFAGGSPHRIAGATP